MGESYDIIGRDKLEFIALKGKGSVCGADIYFSWRDTDKIISAKHDRHEVAGFWRCSLRSFHMEKWGLLNQKHLKL